MDDIPRNFWYRVVEVLPAAVSWAVLILPIALAPRYPHTVAIFITVYVVFWFARAVKSSIFLVLSYRKSKKILAENWGRRCDEMPEAAKIFHVVIMPTYKEEKEILETSISAIAEAQYPLERIFFVLATEERDKQRAEENAEFLQKKFGGVFGGFFHIMHPKNLPDEIPAKGANITFAARRMKEILEERGIPLSNAIVTTLDADNRPHPLYFPVLTWHFLNEPDRERRAFQPLPFFYNNIWEVPFANRIIALANTFWYLSESGESDRLFTASVYAQSMSSLAAVDFWSRQTIVEDLHQFWRSYFHFGGDYEVIPLFVPVYQDALQNRTYFTSLTGQYRQLRRWAWGASEIPYVLMKILRRERRDRENRTQPSHRPPLGKTLFRFFYLWYLQVMWATGPVIILFNNLIPTLANPQFAQSVFAYNLGSAMQIIFTLMLIGIITSFWISFLSLPRPTGRHGALRFTGGLLQWVLLPLVTLVYGAIPALDAQTRLMLNKPLVFHVTEKVKRARA